MEFRFGDLEILGDDGTAKRSLAHSHHVVDIVRAIILVFKLDSNRLTDVFNFGIVACDICQVFEFWNTLEVF